MMRSLTPHPFARPFSVSEFVERDHDTIPAPRPTPADLVAEGLHVDLSTDEAEGIIALLAALDDS